MCTINFVGQKTGTVFKIGDDKRVAGIFIQFPIKDREIEFITFAKPLLQQMAARYKLHTQSSEATGMKWDFGEPGRAMSEVWLLKTNASQWNLTLTVVPFPASSN